MYKSAVWSRVSQKIVQEAESQREKASTASFIVTAPGVARAGSDPKSVSSKSIACSEGSKMREEQPTNGQAAPDRPERLSSLQIALLIGLALFILLIISILISYLIWAFVTLFRTQSAIDDVCHNSSPLWLFCVISIIFTLLQLATGGGKDSEGNVGIISYIYLISSLVLTVVGIVLWASVSGRCISVWSKLYPDLLLLFHVNVILLCVQSVLILSLVLFGAIMMGWLASTWAQANEARRRLTAETYEPIRDREA